MKEPPKEIRIESGIGEFEDVSLGEIGTLSASLYLNAKNSIPHFYTSTKCNLNNALAACKEWLNEGNKKLLRLFLGVFILLIFYWVFSLSCS